MNNLSKQHYMESFSFFTKSHPFHIVNPSDWPIKLALSSIFLMLGLVNFFHRSSGFYTIIAVFFLLLFSFRWVNSMRKETISIKIHTVVVQINFLTGMILFIISEIMIFFGFFWAFFHASLNPSVFIGGVWPPLGLEPLNPFKWPFLNTYILLLSGVMANIFYYSIKSLPDNLDYLSFNNIFLKDKIWEFHSEDEYNCFFFKIGNLFYKKYNLIWLNYILLFILYNKNYFIKKKHFYFLIKYSKNINVFFNIKIYLFEFFQQKGNWFNIFLNYPKKINNFSSIFLLKNSWLSKYSMYITKNILFKLIFLTNFQNFSIIKNLNYFIFLKNQIQDAAIFMDLFVDFLKNWNINKILLNFLKFSKNKFLILFNCLNFTIFLGLFFERIQWYEYAHASFSISDGIYGTVFFLLTGLHGFHVMVGIFLLFYCWLRFYEKDFLKVLKPHVGLSTSVWYWHFVDIVWLFVFFFVYLWSY